MQERTKANRDDANVATPTRRASLALCIAICGIRLLVGTFDLDVAARLAVCSEGHVGGVRAWQIVMGVAASAQDRALSVMALRCKIQVFCTKFAVNDNFCTEHFLDSVYVPRLFPSFDRSKKCRV